VAEELERGHETFLDDPYANAFKAMQVGLAAPMTRSARRTAAWPSIRKTR
jgi:hypothetical protein